MGKLREDVPREFTDDVRWYRYFTQPLLIALGVTVAISFFLCRILASIHLLPLGLLLSTIQIILVIIFMCTSIPKGNLMNGSGMLLYDYFFRKILRRMNRLVYIKGLDDEDGAE